MWALAHQQWPGMRSRGGCLSVLVEAGSAPPAGSARGLAVIWSALSFAVRHSHPVVRPGQRRIGSRLGTPMRSSASSLSVGPIPKQADRNHAKWRKFVISRSGVRPSASAPFFPRIGLPNNPHDSPRGHTLAWDCPPEGPVGADRGEQRLFLAQAVGILRLACRPTTPGGPVRIGFHGQEAPKLPNI